MVVSAFLGTDSSAVKIGHPSSTARPTTPAGEHPFPPRLVAHYQLLLNLLDTVATSDVPSVAAALAFFMARKGKLLRPMLSLMCCEITGGDPRDAVPLAAAIELVHCSSLILDDLPCMDNADRRRGRASLHTRFGEAVAILASVHLLSQAFRITAAAAKVIEFDLVALLADVISCNGMIRGQVLDLTNGGDCDEVRLLKTAPLFRIAAQFGAYAARAAGWQVEALSKFADRLSLAYQVRDDIIDGQTEPAQLQRAREITTAAAAELAAAFGGSAACFDLIRLIDFAVSRET
jgi:geranylgeranyl diphosphate synthase, type II